MKLHHANIVPDWVAISENQRNKWQKLAAKTAGIITPGNLISTVGLCAVLFGLWLVVIGNLWQGTVLVSLGRLADIFDGIVADRTDTKSPLGEAVDASFDKVSSLAALAIFATHGVLPVWLAAVVALQNIANILTSLVARWYHIILHPSKAGKLATACFWMAAISFVIARAFAERHETSGYNVAVVAAYGVTCLAILLGVRATVGYVAAVAQPSLMKNS